MFGEQIYSTGEPAYKRKSKPQRHAASRKTPPPSCTHVLYPYNKMPVVADSRKRCIWLTFLAVRRHGACVDSALVRTSWYMAAGWSLSRADHRGHQEAG